MLIIVVLETHEGDTEGGIVCARHDDDKKDDNKTECKGNTSALKVNCSCARLPFSPSDIAYKDFASK